jgi:hypothetical protein
VFIEWKSKALTRLQCLRVRVYGCHEPNPLNEDLTRTDGMEIVIERQFKVDVQLLTSFCILALLLSF